MTLNFIFRNKIIGFLVGKYSIQSESKKIISMPSDLLPKGKEGKFMSIFYQVQTFLQHS